MLKAYADTYIRLDESVVSLEFYTGRAWVEYVEDDPFVMAILIALIEAPRRAPLKFNTRGITLSLVPTGARVFSPSVIRDLGNQLGEAELKMNSLSLTLNELETIIIVVKPLDPSLPPLCHALCKMLMRKSPRITILLDHSYQHDKLFAYQRLVRAHPPARHQIQFYDVDVMRHQSLHDAETIDDNARAKRLVITLGGDGTVLFTSGIFQGLVPPVLSFALGSLGFLTNFAWADRDAILDRVLDPKGPGFRVNLRQRFEAVL
ncbi:ATP-NAD kinase, partial [Caulochytrium protostelioides]